MPDRYSFENGYALSAPGEANRTPPKPQLTPVNTTVGASSSKVVVGRIIEVPSDVDFMAVMPFATSAGGSEPGVVTEFHFQAQMISEGVTFTTNELKVRVAMNHTGINKGPKDELPVRGLRRIQLTKIVNNTALALTVVNCEYRIMRSRSS